MLLLSTFAFFGFAPVAPAFAAPSLNLSPAVLNDTCPGTTCTHGVGSSFQYTVTASGVGGSSASVFAYQFSLTYDPTILQAFSIDSYGGFFDAAQGLGCTASASNIDNVAGSVTFAITLIATAGCPTNSPSSASTMILGVATFNVTGLGRSDESLVSAILLHNSGGGVLTNIPVTVNSGVFSNTGLLGIAVWPYALPSHQWAFPEATHYSVSGDNSFTPGCLDFFANVNSTGTLAVDVSVRFTVSSAYGTLVVSTPVQLIARETLFPVPLHTCFSPISSSGVVQVGNYHIKAQIFYQQVNIDGSLGPVVKGPLHTFIAKVSP